MDDGQVREGLPTIPAQRCRLILNNWARWLALDRIGFHVVISFFDSLQKVAAHGLHVRADRLFSIPTGSESLLPATGPDGHLGNEASGSVGSSRLIRNFATCPSKFCRIPKMGTPRGTQRFMREDRTRDCCNVAYLVCAHYNAPRGTDSWIVASFSAPQRL